jgi:hypothetical protein
MKNFYSLLLLIFASAWVGLTAQTRYLHEVFDEVAVEKGITYGNNISILTGAPAPIDLKMDVYTPVGDEETSRPVVVYFHTGSFLPPLISGGITGSLSDSTLVEICTRLAKMGYTAIAATYRQGWLPTSEDANVRRKTLLQAAYRGIVDARTCVRYLRKSEQEDGNPFGIDTEKIVLWGQGTGGYISLGAGVLDRYEELIVEKFIDTETGEPYVVLPIDGDPYGLLPAALNIPNHVGYSSDFNLSVNMGGALGDINWIEGENSLIEEPATVGFHVVSDPFAPFGDGPVIVPTTQEFVVNVSGTLTATQRMNEVGANDVLDPVLGINDPLTTKVSLIQLAGITVDLSALGGSPTTPLATDHMYPFILPGPGPQSGPWDWWDKDRLDLVVAGFNAATGATLNSDELHANNLFTNPDMSAEKGRAYIDTIMAYYAPRGCFALDLTECKDALLGISSVKVLEEVASFDLLPNPASDQVQVKFTLTEPNELSLMVFNAQGQMVQNNFLGRTQKGSQNITINTHQLPTGLYSVSLINERGEIKTKRLAVNR